MSAVANAISVDEFQALEQKVLQAVELIKKEREARAVAEAELLLAKTESADLREKLQHTGFIQDEVDTLIREREAVRRRVEEMVAKIDQLL